MNWLTKGVFIPVQKLQWVDKNQLHQEVTLPSQVNYLGCLIQSINPSCLLLITLHKLLLSLIISKAHLFATYSTHFAPSILLQHHSRNYGYTTMDGLHKSVRKIDFIGTITATDWKQNFSNTDEKAWIVWSIVFFLTTLNPTFLIFAYWPYVWFN